MMNRPVNPYVAGAPLRERAGFFGRADTIEWVKRELQNPATNALVIFGQRRIGKTSLLLQLQRDLPAADFLPVYFDLQDQTQRALGAVLADLADTLAEAVGLSRPSPADFDDQGFFFEREFLPQAYEALGDSRRLVFLFDEFDVMDQVTEAELPANAAAKALRPFLRRIMTADSRPAFVFVVGRQAEDLSVDFMATFKSSLVREMWVLLPEHGEDLVRQAEKNGSLKFTEAAVARILSLTSHHPYLTQLLCQRIWQRAYAANPELPPLVDAHDVETSTVDALEAGEQALSWLWNGLSPAEKIYAAALAEVSQEGETIPEDRIIQVLTAHAARLRTREVELAPRDLVKRRVLETAGEREYRFAVELFRRWVRLNKPVRDVKDELDRIEPVADRLYEIGLDYFNRRQWLNAVRFFGDALAAYPRHFRARLYLGETLMEQGHLDEAVGELQQAYELDRDEARLSLARALVAQAEAHEKAGDEDGALAAAEKALEVSPHERAAQILRKAIWARRGAAALETHRFEDALLAYQKAGNSDAFGSDVLQAVGALDEAEQLRAYDLVLGITPDHAETLKQRQAIWMRRGDIALERNDLDTALAAFREAGDEDRIARVRALQERLVFTSLVESAEAHGRAERWTEAAGAYEQLVAQAPDEESRQEWQTALERCRMEEQLGSLFSNGTSDLANQDWDKAQQAFAEVIRHRPTYRKDGRLAASLLAKAVTRRRVPLPGRWTLIVAALLILLAAGLLFFVIEARNNLRTSQAALAEAYFELGQARRNLGDLSGAISQFDLAINLEPEKADYYTWRGIAYREAGDLEAAIADHDRAIELDPQNAGHYSERASTYREIGNLEAALADHDESVRLSPADPGMYGNRAWTYQQLGNLDAALADYNLALELDPGGYYTYYLRGILYRDIANQPDQAVRDFTTFLEMANRENCPECEEADLYIQEQQAIALNIPNSSFESGANWIEHDPDDIQTFEYDDTQAHSGSRSLKIVSTNRIEVDHWVGNIDIAGWEPGGTYWLSVFVKASRPGQLCLKLAAREGHEAEIGCSTAGSDWQLVRGTVTMPDDATHFFILLRTQVGTVYVDDVEGGQFIPRE